MLVLTRNKGEWIQIGDNVRICIVASDGPVRVGIQAPKDVSILREEIAGKYTRGNDETV